MRNLNPERMHRSACELFTIGLIAALFIAMPAEAIKLGVLGDSLSDEYAEETYGVYAQNWNEQLVNFAGIDLGPTATEAGACNSDPLCWGEPRRTGYEYNWALSGATSTSLLALGQHTGLAAQVVPEAIDYVIIIIGANDYYPALTAYQSIYANIWSQAQIDTHNATIVANITTAIDTVLATGAKVVVSNIPDYGLTPFVRGALTNVAGRQRVFDAIALANADLLAVAADRGVVLIDHEGVAVAMFGTHAAPTTSVKVGNVDIMLAQIDTASGGNPTAAFTHDGIHPNTTLQALLANLIMESLNLGYGASLPLFTESEALAHSGIAYGGSDTVTAQIGAYSDHIVLP
ncbi:MAG: SGNH/GDSL hydrolase family protein, partial [Myxococcota bacterium]